MLATLTAQRDFGDEWLMERKFDGERCLARKAGRAVELESAPASASPARIPRCTRQSRRSARGGWYSTGS
jgi:hypothetical protein